MTHKFKRLGIAAIAIAAMSMTAASAAQASEFHATTPTTAAIFASQQNEQFKFTFSVGTFACTQILQEGVATNSGQSQTQTTFQDLVTTWTFTGCSFFGAGVPVHMNGCKFTYTNKHSVTSHTTANTVFVDITGCTAGKVIEFTLPTCVLTIFQQQNLGHIAFQNTSEPQAAPHDVHAQVTIAGLHYETHGVLCPNGGGVATKTFTNGQIIGQTTLVARQHMGSEQITHNGHQYNRLKQTGAQVGLLST